MCSNNLSADDNELKEIVLVTLTTFIYFYLYFINGNVIVFNVIFLCICSPVTLGEELEMTH